MRFLSRITARTATKTSFLRTALRKLSPNDTSLAFPACHLITILGDRDENYSSVDFIHADRLATMRRNWRDGATDGELKSRIIYLRLIYDWPALKSLVRICPGSSTDTFNINDLFNLLDLHIPLGFGVRARRARVPGKGRTARSNSSMRAGSLGRRMLCA